MPHKVKLYFNNNEDFEQAKLFLGRIANDTATIQDYQGLQKICANRPPKFITKLDTRMRGAKADGN